MSSCRKDCPVSGRTYKVPRQRLDAVRRKLDFSDEVANPAHSAPPDKYGHFKKVSESYSSQEIEPPMYTSSQSDAVPDSFLEWFAAKEQAAAARAATKKVTSVQTKQTTEVEMPESFLQFCQERTEKQKYAARPPSPAGRSAHPGECYFPPQHPTPYNTSYYGHDLPGAPRGMIFDPRVTSTPKTQKSPSPCLGCGYYPSPAMGYYAGNAPSFGQESYAPSARAASAAAPVGIGKYACPASTSPQTPPTPSWLYGGVRPTSPIHDSTVSSGDFLESSPQECPGFRQSRSTAMEEYNFNRRNASDTGCSDDLLKNNQKCPTLRVTPIQSSVSFSISNENFAENRQSISKSIESELMAREAQERNQLEADLSRWQQARRKLVMNTANMGA